MLKRTPAISFLLLIALTILTACKTVKTDAGYTSIGQDVSKVESDKIKNSLREISNDTFHPFQYTGANKIAINYRLLSPQKISAKDKYPLVLVLHGSGAIGTDNLGQLGILAKLWAQPSIRKKYPAYIVAPQFPQRSSNYSIDPDKKVLASLPDPCLTTALQLIDSLKKILPIDERKIYVIGFSMGGSGTINALELRPDLFAAGISVSGIPAFNQLKTLAGIPLWLIHGNTDTENPIASDSLLYQQLRSINPRNIKFLEIEGLGHEVYPGLYTGDVIPKWLFRQQTPIPPHK